MATFFTFALGLAVTLGYHGRLTDDEQWVLLDMLAWHLATDSAKAHE